MANHGHDVTMSARLGPKNAKAVLRVVVGDAFDETSQHFRSRGFRLRLHVHSRIIGFVAVEPDVVGMSASDRATASTLRVGSLAESWRLPETSSCFRNAIRRH